MVFEVMVVVKKREGEKGPEGGSEGVDRGVDVTIIQSQLCFACTDLLYKDEAKATAREKQR